MKRFYTAIIILASCFFVTCEVGLGTLINMKGPIVNISTSRFAVPDNIMANQLFDLEGTARSPSKITRMTVTLDYAKSSGMVRMGREWKWEGVWQKRESNKGSWKPYSAADYEDLLDGVTVTASPPVWQVNDDTVYWNVPLIFDGMEPGDYFITVSAWDQAGNHDSNSMKKLKVKYNNKDPNLVIEKPRLQMNMDGTDLTNPEPPDLTARQFTFDPFGQPALTYQNLSNFIDSIPELAYKIEPAEGVQNTTYSLNLAITNRHNLKEPNSYPAKAEYWKWDYDADGGYSLTGPALPTSGIFIDDGSQGSLFDNRYNKTGNAVALSSLVNDFPKDRITPIQLIAKTADQAGNGGSEYKSKGWFMFLPDSDKPFIDLRFGQKVKKGAPVPNDAPDNSALLRATEYRNNPVYDDDGVKSLAWKLYKLQENGVEEDDTILENGKNYFSGDFTFASGANTWPFTTEGRFGLGRFKLSVILTDIYDEEGDEYITYFTIDSNAAPTVKSFSADMTGTVFFGDGNGNVKIEGIAQVEDSSTLGTNDVKVEEVRILWLKPGQSVDERLVWTDSSYAGWMRATKNGYTDARGNKLWLLSLSDGDLPIKHIGTTDGNNNGNYQEDYSFEKTINLFTDLNIGKGAGQLPFDGQEFYVHVANYSTRDGRMRSNTRSVTTLGDTQAPTVSITAIHVDDGTDAKTFSWAQLAEQQLPTLVAGSTVQIEGSWSDNSMGKWTDVPNRQNTLMYPLTVTWEGQLGSIPFTITDFQVDSSGSGTWKTNIHQFVGEENKNPSVTLSASIKDLAGNPSAPVSTIVRITTDAPALVRFFTQDNNGEINSGDVNIYMEFNKPVTFSTAGSPANPPAITLNAKGSNSVFKTVTCTGGNGSPNIYFKYTIAAGDTTDGQPLNVTGISWGNYNPFPTASNPWRGTGKDENTRVFFGNETNMAPFLSGDLSLGKQKTIIIDTAAPTVQTIAPASTGRYGINSVITINVKFSERVEISNTSGIKLTFGNLAGKQADYISRTGPDNLSFSYKVVDGDNTGSNGIDPLSVSGIIAPAGSIKDVAGNNLSALTFTPARLLDNVFIDTSKPLPPTVSGIDAGKTYYGNTSFTIGAIENGATVEYNLNYNSSYPNDGWSTYTGTSTTPVISFPSNGTYNVAVRQKDNAITTQNTSPLTQVQGVKIDSGAILQRISSTNPDGEYAFEASDSGKNIINITMHFRIPVVFSTTPTSANTYLTLNTSGGTGTVNRAGYKSLSADGKTMTFEYVITNGVYTAGGDKLAASQITWGVDVYDKSDTLISTLLNGPNGYLLTSNITGLASENRLNGQKDIRIINGRPAVLNKSFTGDIAFDGSSLKFTFDRNIYRGSTKKKLVIMQSAQNYQIPAVMSEKRFAEIFKSRTDIFGADFTDTVTGTIVAKFGANATAAATAWEALGNSLYERSYNGATLNVNGTTAISDTTVKRVLIYSVNPTSDADTKALSGTITMGDVKAVFRAAEALTFSANDNSNLVEITNLSGNPRILTLKLTGEMALPVKGALYGWAVPNGFVCDVLGTANGGGDITVNDSALTANDDTQTGLRLNYTQSGTAEEPVIRIRKADEAIPAGGGANRQASQPLQSEVTINCRTPGAAIEYLTRTNNDPVGQLIMRANPTTKTASTGGLRGLPNLGTQEQTQAGFQTYEAVKMRPQSGVVPAMEMPSSVSVPGLSRTTVENMWRTYGLNIWSAMTENGWGNNNNNTYNNAFSIGTANYSDGGMEVHIRARARVGGANAAWTSYAYEAAYRSVFVYSNQDINGNGTRGTVNLGGGLNRVWIRGGDSTAGDPTVPDFPLGRDQSKYKKVRLLTPIDGAALNNNQNANLTATNVPNNDIGDGRYLWFWVTWRINVPAFIDVLYAALPADAGAFQAPTGNTVRYLFNSYYPAKEHYPVFPGRTTVIEIRNGYENFHDGTHGSPTLTATSTPPARTDD
jgi:hypothetical protein